MSQVQQQSSTIKVLSILIIIGNVLIMLKDLLSYSSVEEMADGPIPNFINALYLIEFITCLGAIVAAILMLENKTLGFHLYLVFTLIYLLTVLVSAISLMLTVLFILIAIFQVVYLIPPIIFLILVTINWKRSA